MPLYDVKCEKCGWEGEVYLRQLDSASCPRCGGKLKVIFKKVNAHLWKPTYFEGIDYYASTKQDLKEFCKRHNIIWRGE